MTRPAAFAIERLKIQCSPGQAESQAVPRRGRQRKVPGRDRHFMGAFEMGRRRRPRTGPARGRARVRLEEWGGSNASPGRASHRQSGSRLARSRRRLGPARKRASSPGARSERWVPGSLPLLSWRPASRAASTLEKRQTSAIEPQWRRNAATLGAPRTSSSLFSPEPRWPWRSGPKRPWRKSSCQAPDPIGLAESLARDPSPTVRAIAAASIAAFPQAKQWAILCSLTRRLQHRGMDRRAR